jgi:hypothetical protein
MLHHFAGVLTPDQDRLGLSGPYLRIAPDALRLPLFSSIPIKLIYILLSSGRCCSSLGSKNPSRSQGSRVPSARLPAIGPVLLHELTFSFVLNNALGSPLVFSVIAAADRFPPKRAANASAIPALQATTPRRRRHRGVWRT